MDSGRGACTNVVSTLAPQRKLAQIAKRGIYTMNSQLRYGRWVLVLLAAFLMLPVGLLAQEATGRIVGTVTDPTGAVVPAVKLRITNVATGVNYDTTSAA